ncbi:hypothetical protein K505DRAFT_325976 [Melanomma pulvis-pyrius CBS 109.77]|uniref:Uncharacterized protein n=1 Tax=Melanomma pulvis-pyrius CBS 109.77 TaxID=1314802 RepID=A0A6A6X9D1_9PLEO|nr:hypothetical protein K505DRAFT_325976 [Melanomma pulvis-pyrius CBS 109.77]
MATPDYQRLPPSPPPSPPRRRHHHKKKNSDPFFDLDLSNTSPPSPSPPSSPQNGPQEPQEALITRILLTPIIFTSFLISLFLINRSDRARRTTSHRSSPTTWFYFSPSLWIDPEPYQDPDASTWASSSTSHYEPHSALNPDNRGGGGAKKRTSWHLNKKIRKMAKLEISDALEMRGRVTVLLVGAVVVVGVGAFLGLWWMVGRLLWWGR